jgi:phosphoribosylformylglycinamidine cyclo-ligase
MQYHQIVDYTKLDPVKATALEKFSETVRYPERFGIKIVPETLGEPAIALDFLNNDFLLAFNVEGLGTKNKIADLMASDSRGKGFQYYESVGQDTVAMSTNDLLAIGADPLVFGDIISSGDSNWFSTPEKTGCLLEGFRKAANELGMAIPCGETPTLQGIVSPETLDLAGASVGIIRPKSRLLLGKNIQEGDCIIGLESSGIHSNGVSLARKIAEEQKNGYFTELPSGKMLGEELLKPTVLYTRPIIELLKKETAVHYLAPITGHGWKKIMRAKKSFLYEIGFVPEKGELFSFLQEKAGISNQEAYYTWNMGIGYTAIAPNESLSSFEKAFKKAGIKSWKLGEVKKGEKKVSIKPLGIEYSGTE